MCFGLALLTVEVYEHPFTGQCQLSATALTDVSVPHIQHSTVFSLLVSG